MAVRDETRAETLADATSLPNAWFRANDRDQIKRAVTFRRRVA